MYRLDFSQDSAQIEQTTPDKRYLICTQSILTAQQPASFSSWDDVIGLLKKLKSLGHEKTVGNQKTYDLNSGGGVIELQRGERQQLLDFIKAGFWIPDFLEDVRNTYKWVEGLADEPETSDPKTTPINSRREAVKK